jgi:uncharacterized membrane protein YgcG
MDERREQFRAPVDNEQARRRRGESSVQLRKVKREETIAKRRAGASLVPSMLASTGPLASASFSFKPGATRNPAPAGVPPLPFAPTAAPTAAHAPALGLPRSTSTSSLDSLDGGTNGIPPGAPAILQHEKEQQQLKQLQQLQQDSGGALGGGGGGGGGVDDINALADSVLHGDPNSMLAATERFRRLLSREEDPPSEEVLFGRPDAVRRMVEFLAARPEDFPGGSAANPGDVSAVQKLQFEAAWALTNLASGSSRHTRAVVEAGAVPKLVELLSSSPVAACREQAIWCVGNIAGDGEALRELVLRHGALLPILQNACQNEGNLSLLRNSLWVIANLCRRPEARPTKYQPDVWLRSVAPAASVLAQVLCNCDDDDALVSCLAALAFIGQERDDARIRCVVETGISERLVELLVHNGAPRRLIQQPPPQPPPQPPLNDSSIASSSSSSFPRNPSFPRSTSSSGSLSSLGATATTISMSSSGYSNPPPPQSSNPVPHPSPPPLSAPEPPAFRDDPYADGAPSPVVKEALTLCGQIGSGDDPIFTQGLLDAGFLRAAPRLLRLHGRGRQDVALRKEVLYALSNVAAGTQPQVTALLQEKRLMGMVLQCLGRLEDFVIRREALYVTHNALRSTHEVIFALQREFGRDVTQGLCSFLGEQETDADAVLMSLECLDLILKCDDTASGLLRVRASVESYAGEDALSKLALNSPNADICSRAALLLDTYFDGAVCEDDDDGVDMPSIAEQEALFPGMFDFSGPIVDDGGGGSGGSGGSGGGGSGWGSPTGGLGGGGGSAAGAGITFGGGNFFEQATYFASQDGGGGGPLDIDDDDENDDEGLSDDDGMGGMRMRDRTHSAESFGSTGSM